MCDFDFNYEYSDYLATAEDCIDLRHQVSEMLFLFHERGYSAKSAIEQLFPDIQVEFANHFTYVDAEACGYIEAKRRFLRCDFEIKQ